MKKYIPILASALFLFLVCACEDDYTGAGPATAPVDNTDPGNGSGNGNGTGGTDTLGGGGTDTTGTGGSGSGGGTDTTGTGGTDTTGTGGGTSVTGCDYWPYATGSEITFQNENETNYTITCGQEATIVGKQWITATSTLSATAVGYYRCDGDYGYLRQQNPQDNSYFTIRHVKINGAVDDTWTDVVSVGGNPVHYEHTIYEVNGSYEILGVTYNDVMVVDIVGSSDFQGTLIPFSVYSEYISKHAGLIWSTLPGGSIKIVSHNF